LQIVSGKKRGERGSADSGRKKRTYFWGGVVGGGNRYGKAEVYQGFGGAGGPATWANPFLKEKREPSIGMGSFKKGSGVAILRLRLNKRGGVLSFIAVSRGGREGRGLLLEKGVRHSIVPERMERKLVN